MQTAILDAATRVIKRITVDTNPPMLASEIAVSVPDGFTADLNGQIAVLGTDNVTKTAATQTQILQAFPELQRPQLLAQYQSQLSAAIQALQSASTSSTVLSTSTLQLIFSALLAVLQTEYKLLSLGQ